MVRAKPRLVQQTRIRVKNDWLRGKFIARRPVKSNLKISRPTIFHYPQTTVPGNRIVEKLTYLQLTYNYCFDFPRIFGGSLNLTPICRVKNDEGERSLSVSGDEIRFTARLSPGESFYAMSKIDCSLTRVSIIHPKFSPLHHFACTKTLRLIDYP